MVGWFLMVVIRHLERMVELTPGRPATLLQDAGRCKKGGRALGRRLRSEVELFNHTCWDLRHVLVAVNETGAALMRCRGDQSIYQGKPLRSLTTDAERPQRDLLIDRHDFIQQLSVFPSGLASLLDRGAQLPQTAGKLRERHAGGQHLGAALFEKCLDTIPAWLLSVVRKES